MSREPSSNKSEHTLPAGSANASAASNESDATTRDKLANDKLSNDKSSKSFLKHARDVATVVGMATEAAMSAVDVATRGVVGAANLTSEAAKGVVVGASETAREVALKMARTFLGSSTITLPLPEALLNKQIRQRLEQRSDLDQAAVDCGDDRLGLKAVGHFRKLRYTVELDFNVLECQIGREKFLRLRQVDEALDVALADANPVTNWVARKVSRNAFELVNRLPLPSVINHVIRDIPGIQQEGHRLWYIDLEKAGFIDLLNNRSWMVDKLLSLSDFSILPGLNILRESKELMTQLVNQFEIRGLRVQPGRLEIQVGIS